MKKFLALLLACTMVFVFAACDSEPANSSSETSTTTSDTAKEEISDLPESSVPSSESSEESSEEDVFIPIASAQDYFETAQFSDANTWTTVHYLFHEPVRDTGTSSPLVIFLHGLGDTVNEWYLGTASQFVESLIRLENESEEYSAYTLIPSTPLAGEGWWTTSQLSAFKKLINHVIENYNIDPKRIYISGISMGGFTTCQLVNEMPPNTFAAAVPLSGARNMSHPENLHNTAFRIYHSANDTVVSVSCSRNLNEQLIQSGHSKVEYTEFENGDHIYPLVDVYKYHRYTFFGWLFAQRLP